MDCSTPGLPVHHHLLGPAQTHVHRVGDATLYYSVTDSRRVDVTKLYCGAGWGGWAEWEAVLLTTSVILGRGQ